MHLVAALCSDPTLAAALRSHRDAEGRFHLHVVPAERTGAALAALEALEFAGALVLDEDAQRTAIARVQRSGLDAQEAGLVDTVVLSPGGLIGESNLGRALRALLDAARWDARSASVVVLGGDPRAAAVARELSSLGAARLALVAAARPDAERALPRVAASTEVVAIAAGDPAVRALLERADLLVRTDPAARVPDDVLGPHLAVIDLAPDAVSGLRRRALAVGAPSYNLRDVQAHLVAIALSQVLGGRIAPDPFLALLHA